MFPVPYNPFHTKPISLFDELDYVSPFHQPRRPFEVTHPHRNLGPFTRPKYWTSTLDLRGFRPEEVSTNVEEHGNSTQVLVYARHEDNDEEFAEVRRAIPIPEYVDKDYVEIHLTREGHLLVKAPFLHRESSYGDRGYGCGGMWGEMSSFGPHMDLHHDASSAACTGEIIPAAGGGEKFQADVEISGFNLEDVTVHQHGSYVIVEARQERNTGGETSHKQMQREVSIPYGVQLDQMTSRIIKDGMLRLEAPFEPRNTSEGRKIPIEDDKRQECKSRAKNYR